MKQVALRLLALFSMVVTIGLAIGTVLLIVAAVDFAIAERKFVLVLLGGFLAGIAITFTWINHLTNP